MIITNLILNLFHTKKKTKIYIFVLNSLSPSSSLSPQPERTPPPLSLSSFLFTDDLSVRRRDPGAAEPVTSSTRPESELSGVRSPQTTAPDRTTRRAREVFFRPSSYFADLLAAQPHLQTSLTGPICACGSLRNSGQARDPAHSSVLRAPPMCHGQAAVRLGCLF